MRAALATCALVSAGCFSPDLGDGKVVCGSDGSCPAGYVCRADNHCWKTAGDGGAGSDGDMAARAACGDRSCPPMSMCAAGHCQPPTGAARCKRGSDCGGGEVCAPFVVNGVVELHCAPPLPGASGGSSARCADAGVDASCKSGYCVTDANDSTVHLCLVPCQNPNDCGGNNCDPAQSPVVIEGVTAHMFNVCALP